MLFRVSFSSLIKYIYIKKQLIILFYKNYLLYLYCK